MQGEATEQEMAKLVRWLHLSDFHVGMDNYGQRKLFREICDHVSNRVQGGFLPDIVFLTGDIANRGRSEEYAEFFEFFLTPLSEALGDKFAGSILSIPGNHDVDRNRAPFFSREELLAARKSVFDPTEAGKLQREQFALRFTNFSENDITVAPKQWIQSSEGAYAINISVSGKNIGIVGINTAWLCKDEEDRHKLTPGIHILEDGLRKVQSTQLKIVLGHHPLDWLEDSDAGQMRTILAKNNAIYLSGHLHANEARYDQGSQGFYLAIRSGAAFQGRPDDQPKWVNGLLWAEADLDRAILALMPFHWSADHREWKITTDAFPNQNLVDSMRWEFPLPGNISTTASIPLKKTPAKGLNVEPTTEKIRAGWELVTSEFFEARKGEDQPDRLLTFFDGRPPNWRIAMAPVVPRRSIVSRIVSRFSSLEDSHRPTIVNIVGAGGEGKSTAFLQAVSQLVTEQNWTALWRHDDSQKIDAGTIRKVARKYGRVLIAVDEAHSLATELPRLLARLSSERGVHFLLCSRSIDWRAEARELGHITGASDYQEISLKGLDKGDASQLVTAWQQFGKDGMRNLFGIDPEAAVDQLSAASYDEEAQQEDEGSLLGAMLRIRYGDRLKDKVRSILYRLKETPGPGGSLLDSYVLIAALHSEGLKFLSVPVLAEHFNITPGEVQRKIISPLADEAMAAGGGRFVLCRHKAIAKATLEILRETNLYGDIEAIYPDLSRAAILARQKGSYVPDLNKWDYELPKHFQASGRVMIAVAAAESMQQADPDDIRLRVNLSKIHRDSMRAEKAADLFRLFTGEIPTRVAWHEWGVAERWNKETLNSIILATIALADLPMMLPPKKTDAARALSLIGANFKDLYVQYGDPIYLRGVIAGCRLSLLLNSEETDVSFKNATENLSFAVSSGSDDIEAKDLLPTLNTLIGAISPIVEWEVLVQHRVSRSSITELNGLASLVRRHLKPAGGHPKSST